MTERKTSGSKLAASIETVKSTQPKPKGRATQSPKRAPRQTKAAQTSSATTRQSQASSIKQNSRVWPD